MPYTYKFKKVPNVTKYNHSLLFILLFFYINFFLDLMVASWWIISDQSVCFKRSSSMFNIESDDIQSYKKNYNYIFSILCWSSKICRPIKHHNIFHPEEIARPCPPLNTALTPLRSHSGTADERRATRSRGRASARVVVFVRSEARSPRPTRFLFRPRKLYASK
jgi:hypothetical protein